MEILDYILDGLVEALELERELGVRTVEIDRGLIAEPRTVAASATGAGQRVDCYRASRRGGDGAVEGLDASSPVNRTIEQPNVRTIPDLVFIHDRPLSPGGVEMMAKIVTALGLTAEKAPIIVAPPIPNANIFVFLGFAALKKYMPSVRLEENAWSKSPKGKDVLLVKSPEEILRFATVTPAVKKMKEDMWRSLKAVKQRLGF